MSERDWPDWIAAGYPRRARESDFVALSNRGADRDRPRTIWDYHVYLRSKSVQGRQDITLVPRLVFLIRFTIAEGGFWHYFEGPIETYLSIIKELNQPGASGAVQLQGGWIFDADLKRAVPQSYGWRPVGIGLDTLGQYHLSS